MHDWGSGYVTDVAYTAGYYPQQSPVHIAVAARLAGVACDLPDDDSPIHYLELGCGVGMVALTLGAANPSWRVTGVDFNPAHIATARAFARQAGIRNVEFIEADLATLFDSKEASAIPEADFVSAHGVWSWIPAGARAGMVRLLSAKTRAGGFVHLTYNALPGWQSALGMQRVMRVGGRMRHRRSDAQARAGLELVSALQKAGARHLTGDPFVEGLLKHLPASSPAYLAHEFMNGHWEPCFHADVADALSEAKLEWIGSANVLENFPELMLTPAERTVLNGFETPAERELIKDMCLTRAFRQDIFAKGPTRLAGAGAFEPLREITLALAVDPAHFSCEVQLARGSVKLSESVYSSIAAALAEKPRAVGELMSLPPLEDQSEANPAEIVAVLIGSGQALPVLRPGASLGAEAKALNDLVAESFGRLDNSGGMLALASTALGAGLPMSPLELFIHRRRLVAGGERAESPDALALEVGAGLEDQAREQFKQMASRALSRRAVFVGAGLA